MLKLFKSFSLVALLSIVTVNISGCALFSSSSDCGCAKNKEVSCQCESCKGGDKANCECAHSGSHSHSCGAH
jgi:hypothetical protein